MSIHEIQTTKWQATALDLKLESLPKRLSVLFSRDFSRKPGVPRVFLHYFRFGVITKTATLLLLKTLVSGKAPLSLSSFVPSELGSYGCNPHKTSGAERMCNATDTAVLLLLAQPGPAAGNKTLVFVDPRSHFWQTYTMTCASQKADFYTSYKSSGLFFHYLLHLR